MADDTLARDYGELDSAGVAALDSAAVTAGVETMQLMEVAGLQVARCAWGLLGGEPGRVFVIAGRGNNGGDGLVAARHLCAWGCEVSAVVASDREESLHGLVTVQLRAARGSGAEVHVTPDDAAVREKLDSASVVVDALLGTGLRSAPRPPDSAFIMTLNKHGHVLAVDVPSGLDATTGHAFEPSVHASVTCTLTACKPGLLTPEGRAHAGRIFVADIGMPLTAWRSAGLEAPRLVRGGALIELP